MIRRLHIVMVHALAVMLLSSSFTGAVVASYSKQEPAAMAHHAGMDHAQHDHEQAMVSQQSKKDCLAFCFEGLGEYYQAAAAVDFPYPKLIVSSAIPLFLRVLHFQTQSSRRDQYARGPPGYAGAKTVNGLRGLLLLNARQRN